MLKDAPVEVLANAIRRFAAGEEVLDPPLAARALRPGAVRNLQDRRFASAAYCRPWL